LKGCAPLGYLHSHDWVMAGRQTKAGRMDRNPRYNLPARRQCMDCQPLEREMLARALGGSVEILCYNLVDMRSVKAREACAVCSCQS
jgi:hypothetical protein